jgi:hypothetical protein
MTVNEQLEQAKTLPAAQAVGIYQQILLDQKADEKSRETALIRLGTLFRDAKYYIIDLQSLFVVGTSRT